MYLTATTLGVALLLIGINWLGALGCTIILAAPILNPFPVQTFESKSIYYPGLFISLGFGVWQFIQAEIYGLVWLRVPAPWWWVTFWLALWLLLVVGAVGKLCRRRSRSSEA